MFDSIDLPGYVFKSKHRQNVARMRSGGILLGLRENLVNHVQILENECEFVLWIKIDGKVFNLEQPVIFGTIYIKPGWSVGYINNELILVIYNLFRHLWGFLTL